MPQMLATTAANDDQPLIQRWPCGPARAVRQLVSVGLTDPITWARKSSELSVGQQARLAAADLIYGQPGIVVMDDFLATVDPLAAEAAAWTISRAARKAGRTLIVLTPHDATADAVHADWRIACNWDGEATAEPLDDLPSVSPLFRRVEYSQGTLADYRALAHLHYAAGAPTQVHSYHRLTDTETGQLLAVAALVYPDLHNPARAIATNGVYKRTTDRRIVERLNQEVLRFARIIVRPEVRGIGLARQLIIAAVSQTDAVWYECSTAIGHVSDFLIHCGFREVPRPAADAEASLQDWYAQARLSPHDVLTGESLLQATDELSVRLRRRGRQLIWATFHRSVLHRRTGGKRPRQVPNPDDPRWIEAADFVCTRLTDRPVYFISGPIPERSSDLVEAGTLSPPNNRRCQTRVQSRNTPDAVGTQSARSPQQPPQP